MDSFVSAIPTWNIQTSALLHGEVSHRDRSSQSNQRFLSSVRGWHAAQEILYRGLWPTQSTTGHSRNTERLFTQQPLELLYHICQITDTMRCRPQRRVRRVTAATATYLL